MINLWHTHNLRLFIYIVFICQVKINICHQDTSSYRLNKVVSTDPVVEPTEWLIAIFMGARNSLAQFAAGNLIDIAKATTNNKIKVVAQWDQLGKKGAWRYVINDGNVMLDNCSAENNPCDVKSKLVDFFDWAYKKYPAKKVCLVLWNHGVGAIQPSYEDPLRIAVRCEDILSLENNEMSRAILFDDDNKAYLSNTDLKNALLEINHILGRKLDCLGTDACYMAGIEVCFQICDYVKYFVGSEELELAKGWNYDGWLKALSFNTKMGVEDLISMIVTSFEDGYKGRTHLYTQSAVDLSRIVSIKDSHDRIVACLDNCSKMFGRKFLNAIIKARKSCIQFSTKFYVDLHSLYQNLIEKVLAEEGIAPNQNIQKEVHLLHSDVNFLRAKGYHPLILELVSTLRFGLSLIESSVVKNVTSSYLKDAKGISIYFPTSKVIDPSYITNDFAQKSEWTRFLILICQILA